MPEPQPEHDRPAEGATPATGEGRNPAVADGPPSPAPPTAGPRTGPQGTRKLPTVDADRTTPPDDTVRAEHPARRADEPTRADTGDLPGTPGAGASGPGGGGAPDPADQAGAPGMPRTRVWDGPAEDLLGHRVSGSAAVPPPPPRRRVWGQSAEPTPLPPRPSEPPPEEQTPVDPWAGADTSGWHLPSTSYPALPPTLLHPAGEPDPASHPAPPQPGRPPAAPPEPAWPEPPAPRTPSEPYSHTPPEPYPVAGSTPPEPYRFPAAGHTPAPPYQPGPPAAPYAPPPAAHHPPYAGHPTPPVARPVSPPPPPVAARPVSVPPPVSPPPPRPVSPPAGPPAAPPANPWAAGQRPPGHPPPAPPRRRRRWPLRMFMTFLLTVACCCGCPAYFGKPVWDQYPARASLPAEVADLRLRPDGDETVRRLETGFAEAHLLATDTFGGLYTTRDGKRVTVVGGTGLRLTPESDAEGEIERLTGDYQLGEATVVETGVRGRHVRCATGRADGTAVVVCASVDHGSITTAVFTRLSVDDSAALLGTLRSQIITVEQA
ncbi:hypothetical protein [Micromonospora fluostatini]|uniref:hypothetical protein n=1 Tax=Micromonospora sp. JCM 30529 TaxID=3421643 RepID=UPI003D164820